MLRTTFNDGQPEVPGIFPDDLPAHSTRNFFSITQETYRCLLGTVRLTICPRSLIPRVPRFTAHPECLAHLHNACIRLGHPPQWNKTTAVVIHKPSRADRCRESAYTTC